MMVGGVLPDIIGQLISWLSQDTAQKTTAKAQKTAAKEMIRAFLRAYPLVVDTPQLLDIVISIYHEPLELSDDLSEAAKELQRQRLKRPILLFMRIWLRYCFVPDFCLPREEEPILTTSSKGTTPSAAGKAQTKTKSYITILNFISGLGSEDRLLLMQWLDQQYRDVAAAQTRNEMLEAQRDSKKRGSTPRSASAKGAKSPKPPKRDKAAKSMTIGRGGGFFESFRRMMTPLTEDAEFMEMTSDEIETHLTLYESNLFRKITVRELLNKPWKSIGDSGNRAIALITNRFNKASKWVATTIINQPTAKLRGEAIKRWIMVALACFKHFNFNTLMTVIAGLNHTSITRLRESWAEVPERQRDQLKQLETEEMSFFGHMKRYRENLDHALESRSPAVPLITVHIQDIFVICDTNPTFLDPDLPENIDASPSSSSPSLSSTSPALSSTSASNLSISSPPSPSQYQPQIVNFDRLFMLGKTIVKMEMLQLLPPYVEEVIDQERSDRVAQIIAKLPNTFHDEHLNDLSKKLEPPQGAIIT